MVLVPGGPFLTGSDDPEADEAVGPLREASVPSFYIDETEVTNAEVKAVDPGYEFPEGREHHPATGLTRAEAAAILSKMGKRLPTALEWEKAARGTDGRSFPWGFENREGVAHVGDVTQGCRLESGLAPVGSYPEGASPYGCLDMVGNAWEWVSDDAPGKPVRHLIRGGAYGYPQRHNRVYGYGLEDPGVT